METPTTAVGLTSGTGLVAVVIAIMQFLSAQESTKVSSDCSVSQSALANAFAVEILENEQQLKECQNECRN